MHETYGEGGGGAGALHLKYLIKDVENDSFYIFLIILIETLSFQIKRLIDPITDNHTIANRNVIQKCLKDGSSAKLRLQPQNGAQRNINFIYFIDGYIETLNMLIGNNECF